MRGTIGVALALVAAWAAAEAGVTVHVAPHAGKDRLAWAELRQRLQTDPTVSEVVFHAGVYPGGLHVETPKDLDPQKNPLLLRSAGDGEVVFDGGAVVAAADPVEGMPGVYSLAYKHQHVEAPRLWEADTRTRYTAVADKAAVAHFAGTLTWDNDRLWFHTSDGRPPSAHQVGRAAHDCGIFVNRPYVTAQGFSFRNYRLRGKWSTGIDLRTHHITVKDCRASNCSLGFIVTGDDNQVLNCHAEDVGGGVYVGGRNARVEGCRLFKKRDAFMVPMYSQDDTGIQYYHPAQHGVVRNNLCVGFRQGVFVKALDGEYVVEHNTLVSLGWGISNTGWNDRCRYLYNVVVGSRSPVLSPNHVKPGTVDFNCYWIEESPGQSAADALKGAFPDAKGLVADPRFVNPDAGDFRPAADSPCLKLADAAGPCGAFAQAPADTPDTAPPKVRLWAKAPVVEVDTDAATGQPLFFSSTPSFEIQVWANDPGGRPTQAQVKLGDGDWSPAAALTPTVRIDLPADGARSHVAVRVADQAGNWSQSATVVCEVHAQPPAPVFVRPPEERANDFGALLLVETDRPTFAVLEYGTSAQAMKRLESTREEGQKPERFYGREHAMALPPGEIKAGRTCRYRLTVENRQGGKALREGVFYAKGGPQTFYVAPDGDDAGPGSADRPWKTLQHAVDRALPGETILLRPGIYDQPTVLRHGGAPGAPLVIRGEKKWEAILDANRGAAALLSLDNAPYVEMHDLQARWYQSVGIGLYKSPHVKVVGCKVWNDFWTGWPTGLAIRAHLSPDFTGERNVLFRQEHGFWMYFSPRVRLTNNTALSNLYSGACLLYSIQGSVVRNNDFAYNGNDNLVVEVMKGQKDHLKELDCDYNNLGTHLRQQPPGVKHDSVEPREKILSMGSKAIVRYSEWDSKEPTAKRFVSMEEWRQFGGQDRHSVFADPLHLCAQEQRFDLDPRSPNLGAGENGATLGAFPAAGGPAPQP